MPYDQVMHKFKHGELHSGSKKGPPVKNRKQAIAIMLSEKREAEGGKSEYQPSHSISPSHKVMNKMGDSNKKSIFRKRKK